MTAGRGGGPRPAGRGGGPGTDRPALGGAADRPSWHWLRSWGPAWLVMIADVDAASILTSLESGAAYRYDLIGFLLLLVVPLFFVQEAAGRIGAVTGRGIGELVRTTRSRSTSLALALPVAVADVASYVAEYAGIAIGLSIFGIPLLISVPTAFLVHIGLVARGRYVWVERILVGVSIAFVLAVGSALLLRGPLPSSPIGFPMTPSFVFLVAANAGAVVMPFMLFYQSSATAEKGSVSVRSVRLGTFVGAVASELLMVAFLLLGAGMPAGSNLFATDGLATALGAVGGRLLPYAFGIGLVAAAFLALVVISLGSAWGVAEALGISRRRTFWVYTLESMPAVIVPFLFPHLLGIVLVLMVLLVFVLAGPAIAVGLLASDREVMGAHASKGVWRVAYWASLVSVVACGVLAVL